MSMDSVKVILLVHLTDSLASAAFRYTLNILFKSLKDGLICHDEKCTVNTVHVSQLDFKNETN